MRTSLLFTGLVSLTAVASLSACDSFVENIDPPVDRVIGDSLNSQDQIEFLVTGLKEGFNDSYDALAVAADLLSDAAMFDQRVVNATFPTFGEIDSGDIPFDNNTIDGIYGAINEYRFLSDDLLARVELIEFEDDPDTGNINEAEEDRRSALYAANFHGGVSRYFLAAYFSPDPQAETGGSPISTDPDNPGPVIPSSELYAQAQQKLETALGLLPAGDTGAYQRRLINTMRARIALFDGDRSSAAAFASNGLVQGDAPYQGLYVPTSQNNWYTQGGRGRTQVSVANRFADYDAEDNRTLVEAAPTVAGVTVPFFRQALYDTESSPLPFLTWQENALILAEEDIFDGDDDDDEARRLINLARESRGLPNLDDDDDVDQDTLIEARDRELFTRGLRLIDQRRFGIPLANNARFFPITQSERVANPNI